MRNISHEQGDPVRRPGQVGDDVFGDNGQTYLNENNVVEEMERTGPRCLRMNKVFPDRVPQKGRNGTDLGADMVATVVVRPK